MLAHQAAALIAGRHFKQADRMIGAALRWRPHDVALLEQHAFSAHNSGRYALARGRWERLRRHDPTHVMAWTGVACNLREMGHCDEAAMVALDASALFAADLVLGGELARLFRAATTRPVKERILAALRSAYPDQTSEERGPGSSDLVRAAELAFARADWRQTIHCIDQLRSRPASSIAVDHLFDVAVHELAFQAEQARYRNPADSLRDFDLALRFFPEHLPWVCIRIDSMIRLARLDDAEDALRTAINRFGAYVQPISFARATLSAKRELWETAKLLLVDHLGRFPGDWQAADLLARVSAEWTFEQSQTSSGASLAANLYDSGSEDDVEIRHLLLGFESIGDSCEFGLVQRHFKAEPIGLFRWNNTTVNKLCEALEERLVGIGSAEFTNMEVVDDSEYFLTDRRWGFGFHTFCMKEEVPFDALYPKMCKRLNFLRDKFLDDLRAGEKTFVLKSDTVTLPDLKRLHRALSQGKPVRLLCVKQLARAPFPAQTFGGDVFEIEDDLYIGYVKRFGLAWPHRDIQLADWVAICQGVAVKRTAPFTADRI